MQSAVQTFIGADPRVSEPKAAILTGRAISTLVVLFLVFDGIMKVIREPHVLAASADFGYPLGSIPGIGVLLLACTIIYVIPRTNVLGAVLLTGYLGGAVASNVRVEHPVFQCVFPVIFGALVWAGLLLRDRGLREFFPLRRNSR